MARGRSIWLLRHACRLDVTDPSWSAGAARPFDTPLSPAGRAQAEAVAARLCREPITHLFSSPFLRCLETARPIARRSGLTIAVEPALSEWLNPEWFPGSPELLSQRRARTLFPEIDAGYVTVGTARYPESAEQARARSARAARLLAERFAGDLAMVCHGASLQGAAAGLLDRIADGATLFADFPFAGLLHLVAGPGRFQVAEMVPAEALAGDRGPC